MELVLDIETNSSHSHIWIVCCRNVKTSETWTFTKEQKNELQSLLAQAETIIGHNLVSFDKWHLLNLWGIQIPLEKCYDTLIVSRLLDPNRVNGHSLDSWGVSLGVKKQDYKQKYIEAKTEQFPEYNYSVNDEWNFPLIPVLENYCLQDTAVTSRLYRHLRKKTTELKFSDLSVWVEHQVGDIIAEQERNGVLIDQRLLFSLNAEIEQELRILEKDLINRFEPTVVELKTKTKYIPFNPGSRLQIVDRLKRRGWEPTQFTEKGNVELDETILEGLVDKIPEASLFLRFFLLQKTLSFTTNWIKHLNDKTGRIHGKVIANGAVTGRATHSNPNLGNVPSVDKPFGKACRGIFVGDEVLVGCDLSGIELRCLAHYMQDDEYTNELLNGDVHTKNQLAAGLPTRANAKTFIYAFLYGAGDAKIGSIVGGGSKEGAKLIDSFLRATPNLAKLKEKVNKIASSGSVPGLDGRRIWVRHKHASLNSLLQSAGAIISKVWMIKARDNLAAAGIQYKQVLWVHDEIEVECKKKDAEKVAEILVKSANQVQDFLGFRVKIDAEAKIGKSWADVH